MATLNESQPLAGKALSDKARFPLLIVLFAVAFAAFFMVPAVLSAEFSPYRLLKIGDVIDLTTPLVLIPLYGFLCRLDRREPMRAGEAAAFMVLAALWVEGQGMHLAANAIGHLLKEQTGTDAYELTHFLDEVLSHYFWHLGVIGLSALLLWRQWRGPIREEGMVMWPLLLAGVLYGFTFFVAVIEAGTAPLGVPFAAVVAASAWTVFRGRTRRQPLLGFFAIGYSVASVLFIGWGVYWGGLPEFSEVGIIE